jgi:hypothetical protein
LFKKLQKVLALLVFVYFSRSPGRSARGGSASGGTLTITYKTNTGVEMAPSPTVGDPSNAFRPAGSARSSRILPPSSPEGGMSFR